MSETEIKEIRDSQIRVEENIKTILSSISTINRDIEEIKRDLNDNINDISVMKAEQVHLRDKITQNKNEVKIEIDKIWERIRERDKSCIEHDKQIDERIKTSKREVFKDIKLWIFGSLLVFIIGSSAAIIKFYREIEHIKTNVELLLNR